MSRRRYRTVAACKIAPASQPERVRFRPISNGACFVTLLPERNSNSSDPLSYRASSASLASQSERLRGSTAQTTTPEAAVYLNLVSKPAFGRCFRLIVHGNRASDARPLRSPSHGCTFSPDRTRYLEVIFENIQTCRRSSSNEISRAIRASSISDCHERLHWTYNMFPVDIYVRFFLVLSNSAR